MNWSSAGSIFSTTVDSEIILHLLAQPNEASPFAALRKIQGAYSLVMMTEREIIGVRDPFGFRPLSLGKVNGAYVLSSETCAFDLITPNSFARSSPEKSSLSMKRGSFDRTLSMRRSARSACLNTSISRGRIRSSATSTWRGCEPRWAGNWRSCFRWMRTSWFQSRTLETTPRWGSRRNLRIPYNLAFVRNHYVGRSFLQPTQVIRDSNVRVKLNLIKEAVKGKRVVVVDDSIVRGTTARSRVVNLREAGAKEVHMRISCPPHKHACHYGIDFPDPEKLLANQCSMEQIREYLGADSIGYLDVPGMVKATGQSQNEFCLACFNGRYPVPVDPKLDKYIMERRQNRVNLLAPEEEHPKLF